MGDIKIKTYEYLDKLGVHYTKREHEAYRTIAECKLEGEEEFAFLAKNLFLTNSKKDKYYLLVLRDDKKFSTKVISSQIGETRMSFGSEEKMFEYLNITPGSVSPMGLIFDNDNKVTLLLDKDVLKYEKIACHPCMNTATMLIKVNEFVEKFIPSLNHNICWVDL